MFNKKITFFFFKETVFFPYVFLFLEEFLLPYVTVYRYQNKNKNIFRASTRLAVLVRNGTITRLLVVDTQLIPRLLVWLVAWSRVPRVFLSRIGIRSSIKIISIYFPNFPQERSKRYIFLSLRFISLTEVYHSDLNLKTGCAPCITLFMYSMGPSSRPQKSKLVFLTLE